jgi:hypothetical protein
MQAVPSPTDAASAHTAIAAMQSCLLAQDIHTMRTPPPEPTTCCGRGCNGCVWEGYLGAVVWWLEDARALLPP